MTRNRLIKHNLVDRWSLNNIFSTCSNFYLCLAERAGVLILETEAGNQLMHMHGQTQTSWGRAFVASNILTFQGRCKLHEVPVSELSTSRALVISVGGRASTMANRKRIHLWGCTSHLLVSRRVLWPSGDESYTCSKACWDRMVKHSRSRVQIPPWFHLHGTFFLTMNPFKRANCLVSELFTATW